MAWKGKISALVLTYNRKEILVKCLGSILTQVEPPDEIIVLDNGSTDGTCGYLETSGILKHNCIFLYRHPKNAGPSVGVDALFRLALQRGNDWLWYVDDDTIADADALMELKNAYSGNFSDTEEVGFLKSVAVSADGSPNGVPEVDLRSPPGQAPTWADRLSSGLVKVRCATFVSIFVPRTTLTRIGNIYPDFRFYGEDTDFTLRTTDVLSAYLVGRSKVTHLNPELSRFRVLAKKDPKGIDAESYYYRNNLYFRWYYYSAGRTVLFVCKCLHEALLALGAESYPIRRVTVIMRGLLSGLILVMRGKEGPSHHSLEEQTLPVQLQPKPIPE